MKTIWTDTTNFPSYPKLRDHISCDAVVVGGGLCGILSAYMLKRKGLNTILLEGDNIGGGQTSVTTGKITVAHSLIYSNLSKSIDTQTVKIYGMSALASINDYRKIIKRENIECHFEELPAYLYSLHGENLIKKEYEAASSCGLDCSITKETDLPFPVTCALKYPLQAQFNPLMFISSIAEKINIFENSPVKEIKSGRAITDTGSVKAKYFIIATNFPQNIFPGFYFAKMHREMSHACAFLANASIKSMYIGIDGGYNYRTYKDYIIASGENHVSGLGIQGVYERMENKISKLFPESKIKFNWSAEDSVTLDHMPYIGYFSKKSRNVFICSGFGKWGMTGSMTAAKTISDKICGKSTSESKLFDPQRKNFSASIDEFGGVVSRAITGITSSYFKVPDCGLSTVAPGEGKIISHMGRKAGVYKDIAGKPHFINPKCPHLGCELKWNPDDRTWDCPCHGSRFSYDGSIICGPAEKSIKMVF